mgnify:CR=1 FL=1
METFQNINTRIIKHDINNDSLNAMEIAIQEEELRV